jgi:hypothetical protein
MWYLLLLMLRLRLFNDDFLMIHSTRGTWNVFADYFREAHHRRSLAMNDSAVAPLRLATHHVA